ncbi:MAG: hypothetical protein JRH11_20560 [Deltaproteobacteria bacterium]|nr:hypothetical protein [Deltaproteobacteria bacterium]
MHQAAALYGFAEAYLVTGDDSWLRHAESIHRYASSFMQHADGTWYATQEDAAPSLPQGMDAIGYYALPDEERRRYGIPPIDHGVYTDLNGLMIRAYARLYEATRDERFLREATRAAHALLGARQLPSGAMRQSDEDRMGSAGERMRSYEINASGRVYLKAQPYFGLALSALYRSTGEARYLEASRGLGDALLAVLEDRAGDDAGGFFATTGTDTDGLIPREKPFYDNVAAGRFLLALAVDAHEPRYREAARRALAAVAVAGARSRRGARLAELALALEGLSLGPVEFSVVTTDPSADDARALFSAGVGVYEPRKALHYEAPGRYPDLGRAAVFVCTDNTCSSPVFDPGELRETAAHLGLAAPGSACGPREGAAP